MKTILPTNRTFGKLRVMERADVPTLPGLLERAAAQFPTAGVAFEDDRQTYGELLASATEYARRLRTLGIERGDKVGIFAGDRPEYLWALYGAALLGAVAVPVNGRFKVRELRHAITNAELKVLFCGGGFANHAGLVAEALEGIEGPTVIAWDPDAPDGFLTDFDTVEPTDFDRPELALQDPCMILYTSGTTAMPKGCVLSQEALVRPAYAMRDRFALTDEDRMWDALPLFHLASLLPLHACMLAGASYVAMRRFDPAEALAQMERERCTTAFPAFETVWLAILNHPNYASTDLSSMRLVLNVGTRERLEQMQATMHWATQISSYGCTELGGVCAFGHIEDPLELRVTTSGRPFPGMEIRVIDPETGAQKPVGETGEIICRGHSMFSGYYREPELTAAVIDDEGFFHTGDLGALDADGRVAVPRPAEGHAQGRRRERRRGRDRGPPGDASGGRDRPGRRRARRALHRGPGRFRAAARRRRATEDELIGYCHGAIATYKVPRYVRFTDEWPMSGTKIQKFRLREQITAELDAAGIAEAPKLTTPASARTVLQPR